MPLTPAPTASRPLRPALVWASALLAGLAVLGAFVVQQVRMAPSVVLASSPALGGTPGARTASTLIEPSGPAWNTLSPAQKQALAPLQERWGSMGETQKRRWLALAHSFTSLPPAEQEKLHSRMSTWASLSAQQRSQARLNYAITNRLAPADKRAQWEAYQALSEEEKRRLAARAAPKPTGAATALRPIAPRKLARVPAATQAPSDTANPPKIPPSPTRTAPSTPPAATPPTLPAAAHTAPITMPAPVVGEPLPPLPTAEASDAPAPASAPATGTISPDPDLYRPN